MLGHRLISWHVACGCAQKVWPWWVLFFCSRWFPGNFFNIIRSVGYAVKFWGQTSTLRFVQVHAGTTISVSDSCVCCPHVTVEGRGICEAGSRSAGVLRRTTAVIAQGVFMYSPSQNNDRLYGLRAFFLDVQGCFWQVRIHCNGILLSLGNAECWGGFSWEPLYLKRANMFLCSLL